MKKINEDLSISDRFTDPTQTLSSMKKMLDRSNIMYDYTTQKNISFSYFGTVETLWYHLTIYQYGTILYDVYIKEGVVSILNVYEGNEMECYTMMDLIYFISNDNPTLVNIGVIKKINEKYIDELVNCINNLSKLKSFFDEYNIEYNYHKMYNKSELWYELNIDNSDIKLNVFNDYIEVMYLDEKKTLYTLYEVVNFISNKLNIKLISESLSDSTKLTDDNKYNIEIVTKLLVNSKIKYKMSPSSVNSSGNIIYIINEDDEVQFLIRLFRKIRKIEYVGSVTSYSYSSSSIDDIYDVITFISKYNPNLINRRVLKKINN